MGEKMHKITMTNFQMQTLQDAFEHFITRCRVKNLSEEKSLLMMRDGQIIYEGAWDKEQGDLEQFYMEEFE